MKNTFSDLFVHWKTTLAGSIIGLLTIMLYTGKININDFATGLGTVATVIGLLAKDWDKTDQ